ncbi:MAG: T9SS type A sorting domain-containing protein, partial [Bacteroidales bacterium]|nr:T9SS type A sorting domain-containing protein [Bacteroidales bacterium]
TMDPKGTTWTGILIADDCPDVGTCLDHTSGSSGTRSMNGVSLTAGNSYYIMVDTWPSPNCIPDFDLTITESGPDDPATFAATTYSLKRIDLAWTQNGSSDDVLVAWNSTNTFGVPVNGSTYSSGDPITGGGTVLYYGSLLAYNHTNLTAGTPYYYKAWSYNGSLYSDGVTDNATTSDGKAVNPSPANNASGVPITAKTFDWDDVLDADSYTIDIGTATGLADIVDDGACPASTYTYTGSDWDYNEDYFWTVTTVYTNTKATVTGDEWVFYTACGTYSLPIVQGFNQATTPMCWNETVVVDPDGDATLTYVTNGYSPTCSPYEGTHMVKFNSYNCDDGDELRLESPEFSTTGMTAARVLFAWYECHNWSTYLTEGVTVQWSLDGNTWNTGTFYQRYNATDGWYEKTYDLPSGALGQSSVYIGFLFHSHYGYNCYFDDLTIEETPTDAMDWCNLQYPASAIIDVSQNVTVYSQGYEPGVTDAAGQGAGIDVWIGYSTSNTNPSTWINWVASTYNTDVGNNDEYMSDLGVTQALAVGTYYYASRWQLNSGSFTYGGYSAGGGGFWDGTTYVSGVLTVNPPANDDCSGAISLSVNYTCTYTTGTNVGATDSGETPTCADYQGGDVWFSAVVPATGYLVVECAVNGGFTDGGMSAWTGDCASLTQYECDDDDGPGFMPMIEINDMGLAGETLYFSVWEYGNDVFGPFDICAHTIPTAATWNGSAKSNDWHDANNWSTGIPGPFTDVTIPAGLSTYPTISASAACNNIILGSDASGTATLVDDGYLTVNGTATVQRYYATGAPTLDEWHLISAPISDAQAGIYETYYVQSFDEATVTWNDVTLVTDPLTSLQGFAFYAPLNMMTFDYVGTLGDGTYNISISAIGTHPDGYHWNLFGNPYPSSLDWDLVLVPNGTHLATNGVYYLDQATGNYLSYLGNLGGGSQHVPPGQGFLIAGASHGAMFTVNNSMRTHAGGSTYYKSEFDNLLVLEAEGNNFTDAAYLRFDEEATAEIDKQFDAYKLFTTSNPQLPQIYTVGGDKLSINVLPETEMVSAGFKAGTSGIYTINIKEVTGMANVILEDLINGTQTDLMSNPYIFNYNVDDQENRFIVHFTPLAVPETFEEMVNIFSFNTDVYVTVPANTQGNIVIYNMIGQEVASQRINGVQNIITLERSSYYVVKVLSDESLVTRKVFIK